MKKSIFLGVVVIFIITVIILVILTITDRDNNYIESSGLKIIRLSCENLNEDIEKQLLNMIWERGGEPCVMCQACGCSCTTQDFLISGEFSIDVAYVSCIGIHYSIRKNNETITECYDLEYK